ncbi:hypothetical protein T01_1482 [Trichinella spiralis]|uniref:Uncharacterized protein n=1 Tax=Trichinella spiralis TaxID=6334 RepID=A0A0V1AQU7_TRISP|nr:hypothetical protein T01_1482 [Trichinella spiralis]
MKFCNTHCNIDALCGGRNDTNPNDSQEADLKNLNSFEFHAPSFGMRCDLLFLHEGCIRQVLDLLHLYGWLGKYLRSVSMLITCTK